MQWEAHAAAMRVFKRISIKGKGLSDFAENAQGCDMLTKAREAEIRGTLDSCLMPATVAELLAEIDRLRAQCETTLDAMIGYSAQGKNKTGPVA